jgi:hypothetical protein
MKAISRGQALEISARVGTQVNWDELDGGSLQNEVIQLSPEEFGARFTAFLRNGARLVVGALKFVVKRGFNPEKFIGKGWSIVEDETDSRSKALTELDLTKVQFVTTLKDGETYVKGEEKLKRLKKSGNIRLDADIFLTLWENQHLIPESWKEKVNGKTRFIYFDGTVLRLSSGDRYVLYLCWCGGAWSWDVRWLDLDWGANRPSAVLAPAVQRS